MKKILVAFVLLFSAGAFAGDSGCGLGSMVLTKNSKLVQLLAMTTNHSTLTQPLGITSGTSGCSASGLVSREKEIQYFVQTNQKELSVEIASGQGEKVYTLATMYGCSGSNRQAFASYAQKNYAEIFSKESIAPNEVIQNLESQLRKSDTLIQSCQPTI